MLFISQFFFFCLILLYSIRSFDIGRKCSDKLVCHWKRSNVHVLFERKDMYGWNVMKAKLNWRDCLCEWVSEWVCQNEWIEIGFYKKTIYVFWGRKGKTTSKANKYSRYPAKFPFKFHFSLKLVARFRMMCTSCMASIVIFDCPRIIFMMIITLKSIIQHIFFSGEKKKLMQIVVWFVDFYKKKKTKNNFACWSNKSISMIW